MSPRSSLPSARAVLLTCALAAACGALGAVVLVALRSAPPGPPIPEPPAGSGGEGSEVEPEPGVDSAEPPGRRRRDRRRRRRGGGSPEGDPEMAAWLDSSDADERLLAARELLRMGPQRLPYIRALSPQTQAGLVLLGEVDQSLDWLRLNQGTRRYRQLTLDKQLELELTSLLKVLPQRLVREERRDYWQAKVGADPARVAAGHVDKEELLLAELALARARLELEEISRDRFHEILEERVRDVRAWVARQETRQGVPGIRAKEWRRELEAVEGMWRER